MATLNLSTTQIPDSGVLIGREELSGTAGQAREVVPPLWAGRVTFHVRQSDDVTLDEGKVATTGEDDVAIGDDWMPIPSACPAGVEFGIGRQGTKTGGALYVAAATNGAFLHYAFERA